MHLYEMFFESQMEAFLEGKIMDTKKMLKKIFKLAHYWFSQDQPKHFHGGSTF
jgi:hypothetical protein